MSGTCLRCRDLRRAWGFAKVELHYVAQKCAARQSVNPDLLAAAVARAKELRDEAARILNEHRQMEHGDEAAS